MGACSSGQSDEVELVHEMRYPMYVVKVTDFLDMEGGMTHQELKAAGKLYQWVPGMFAVFVSHQWLGHVHPDPLGEQLQVLRDGLRGLVEGSLKVEHNFVATIYGVSLDWSESKREALHQGYLFLDLCSLPQILDLGTGSVDFTNTDASLAVQSIPAYVERCDLFIALAPELTHADSGAHCNYTTWLTRGWCRAELWYRTLSNRKNTSVIVMLSAVEAECMFYQNKYQTRIVDGQFTVEEDRAVLTRLGEEATDKKIKHLRSRPDDLHWYRYFVALRNRWVGQPNRTWTVPDFLEHFMFDSLADAAIDGSHMFGLLCAVVAGDCSMVRALVSAQADVNRQVSGLADMGFYPGITPLMVAAISEQSGPVMSTLLELKADIHARSWMGVNSLFLARSAEQVAVLLEAKVDLEGAALPAHLTPLTGVNIYSNVETVVALLEARCDPNPELAGAGFGPLHAAGLFSRGNPEALDMARLLIMQRADVNVPARPTMLFGLICGLSQSRANLCGFDACPARTRFFASLPGLTPLGIAASVGSETLVNLLLEHRAEPEQPNGRGDVPRYLALANGHKHVYALLEDTFSI
ncbi:unnamed protein product [Durusdinium trenchii]|uniref:Uncharacterized protein n=1 Tax=Durusdinium trenchii TaxID=1381693 RepID=A0ABP0NIQ1_9DINO